MGGKRFRTKAMRAQRFIFPFFLLPPLWPPSLASCSSTEEYPPPPTARATTAETCRPRRGIQTTPGPTRLAATKDDEKCELCHYLKLLTCEIHNICEYICQDY